MLAVFSITGHEKKTYSWSRLAEFKFCVFMIKEKFVFGVNI